MHTIITRYLCGEFNRAVRGGKLIGMFRTFLLIFLLRHELTYIETDQCEATILNETHLPKTGVIAEV